MTKVSILSNVNMEPLKSTLDDLRWDDYHFCDFGQYTQELIDDDSITNTGSYDLVFIHIDGEEFLKDYYYQLPEEDEILKNFDDFLSVVSHWIVNHPEKNIIFSNIVFPPYVFTNFLDQNSIHSFDSIEKKLNEKIRNVSGVTILGFDRLVKKFGHENLCGEKYWYLGRIKYTNSGFNAIGQELSRLANALQGRAKKVLVCDLDNVLWGGIVGEQGAHGVDLSEDGIGKVYRDLQKSVKALKSLGVLLAINSKNNEEDVREIFEDNPMMILKYEDFVVKKINWNNKVQNLKEIAEELDLHADSFVFIDDSPHERLLIRENLEDVAVPEFPSDVALLKKWFIDSVIYTYFGKVCLTGEDGDKDTQYKRKFKRDALAKKFDQAEYIKSLDIKLEFVTNPEEYVDRLAQLTQKTNQFNVTTKRYQRQDIEKFISAQDTDLFGLLYRDKFGEEGLIGEAIVHYEQEKAVLDTFLLSCRVLGRGVEHAFIDKVLKEVRKKGRVLISADYIPTKKNSMASGFYKKCGFKEISPNKFEGEINQLVSTNYKFA